MIQGADGGDLRFSGAALDITSRKIADDDKQLLMEELSHRVKNTFSAVQAIAAQTLRGAGPDLDIFQDRLLALSRAHDVLLQKDWTSSTLISLIEKVLRLDVEGARFRVKGPDLTIGPKAAMSLSLLLHELATNAVKYDALSVDAGEVEVLWSVDGELFELDWRELGGPAAVAPQKKGFGSRLIAMGVNGSRMTELNYTPHGLRARFRGQLADLGDKSERRAP